MTKKEVVSTLRKAFNNWASMLPDIEYKSCNDASEFYNDGGHVNNLHVLEVATEEAEEGGNRNDD